jgi:hypothetical protein
MNTGYHLASDAVDWKNGITDLKESAASIFRIPK